MTRKRAILSIVIVAALSGAVAAVMVRLVKWKPSLTTIQGAVIRSAQDPSKQAPLSDALVTAVLGDVSATATSDASGYFHVTFPQVIWPGQTITLHFTHPGYHSMILPLKLQFRSSGRQLIVAALKPEKENSDLPSGKSVLVSNVRIRYTVNTQTSQNVGSAVRMFQVVNQGDVPCRHQGPCSPSGYWKAATASITMDAGAGNEFRDVRASCIAGPCPFTRIDKHGFDQGGRSVVVSALNWSDTATFLVQAEVFHTSITSNVNESYPVIFDRTLNFTLPGTAEGVTIEAEIDKTQIVFPLGADLYLDWATCTSRSSEGSDSTLYQCQLKPGYRF